MQNRVKLAQNIAFALIGVLIISLVVSLFLFFNQATATQTEADRDAAIIMKKISSNNLTGKYIKNGGKTEKKTKSEIKASLIENVALADEITYNDETYTKEKVLNNLTNKIYKLEFSNLKFTIKKVQIINRLTTKITFTGRQINIGGFLNKALASANDQLQIQQGVDSLSQTEYALAEYMFMNRSWDDYLNNFQIKGDLLKSTLNIHFVPGNKSYFQISAESAEKVQGLFIK